MLQLLIRRNYNLKALYNICKCPFYFISRQVHKSTRHQKLIRLEPNTFQPRVLNYFISDSDMFLNNEFTEYFPQNYQPDYLRKIDYKELKNSINFLLVGNITTNFKYHLHYVDKECCLRLPELSFSQLFELLNMFFYYLPHKITTLEFYKKSIHMLSFSTELCSKSEIIKLCFYVGLQKKTKQSQYILTECLATINKNHSTELNIIDMAVLCNSCYKTSTKIKHKPLLNKITEIINNNLSILNDPPIFMEFVKSLRHNQYQDEEILTTISQVIIFNKTVDSYNFTACSHMLALYADALFYDENLIRILTNKCITHLQNANVLKSKKEHFSKQIRIKDLSNFLWSLGYLFYENFDQSVITNHVEPFLSKYITLENLDKDVEHVVDILLSLYILGHKPSTELITSVVTNHTASTIYGKRKQAYTTRFYLLLSCIRLEQKELFDNLNVKLVPPPELNVESQLKNRPLLKKVYESLKTVAPRFDIKKVQYTMYIPHLHIMGITGYNEQNKANLHVELVDEKHSIKNTTDKADGFMNLKIRLVRNVCRNVLVIFQSEVADKNKAELQKYLEKRMKRTYVP